MIQESPLDIFITTNGPGEMATWVTPVVRALRKSRRAVRISLFILPCRFSSGNEDEVAMSIPEIDYVFRAKDFRKCLLTLPFKPHRKGVVLFLGGDLLWALFLKWRYSYRAIAYTEGDQSWKMFYDAFFLRDRDGDLMYAYFQQSQADERMVRELRKSRNIVFFPGSRPEQFRHLFPLMQRVVPLLPGDVRCIFNIASFIPEKMVQKYLRKDRVIEIEHGHTLELMKSACLAVTIPGTNNIQLAYLNVPALVIFPFNFPDVVHFRGIGGALLNLPILRTFGKRFLLKKLDKRVPYASLVNSKEKRLIYPELRGNLDEKKIAEAIQDLLNDYGKIRSIGKTLMSLNKESTVLDKILSAIDEF